MTVRRLLVVRNDRLGDLVLTLPLLEAAREAFPDVRVAVLVKAYTAPLLQSHPHVDELLVDRNEEPLALGRRLARGRYDAALVVNTNTRNCLAVFRANVPLRVTWSHRPAGLLLGNRHVHMHRSRPPVHESEFAMAFLRRLGVEARVRPPRLTPPPLPEHLRAELAGEGPLFAMAPGSGGSAYNWPPERYAELAARLAAHGRVLVTGSAAEAPLLERVHRMLPPEARTRAHFHHDLSLPELAAALAEADAFTASSTGSLHLAAAVGTHVVGLFSPHPAHVPAKWGPLGEGHTVFVAPLREGEEPHSEVMLRIGVDEVVAANLRAV